MKTFVTFGKSETSVEVEIDARGRVLVGGVEKNVQWIATGDGVNLVVDGRVVDAKVSCTSRGGEGIAVGSRSLRTTARIENERERAVSSGARRTSASDKIVRSPMPGRIVRLSVTEGAHVIAGGAIAVVEAMKMENEVATKGAGIVKKVHVQVGDTVLGNAPLVTLA